MQRASISTLSHHLEKLKHENVVREEPPVALELNARIPLSRQPPLTILRVPLFIVQNISPAWDDPGGRGGAR
jgi:hypothetical protein